MMEKRIDRMDAKLDTIIEKLQEQNITLARNTDSLIIHERRTTIAEEKLSLLQLEVKEQDNMSDLRLDSLEELIKPIAKQSDIFNAAFIYVLPALLTIAGLLIKFGIIKL